MHKYTFTFIGRQSNAIGKCSKFTKTIQSTSLKDAIDELYTEYEHISNLKHK